jgi:hypothetical protein
MARIKFIVKRFTALLLGINDAGDELIINDAGDKLIL